MPLQAKILRYTVYQTNALGFFLRSKRRLGSSLGGLPFGFNPVKKKKKHLQWCDAVLQSNEIHPTRPAFNVLLCFKKWVLKAQCVSTHTSPSCARVRRAMRKSTELPKHSLKLLITDFSFFHILTSSNHLAFAGFCTLRASSLLCWDNWHSLAINRKS